MAVRPPAPVSLEHAFTQLDDAAARLGRPRIRIERADGSTIEGTLHSIEPAQLTLIGDANEFVQVPAAELRALQVEAPRRAREWVAAGFGIVVATTALIGYAQLPFVRPDGGTLLVGFLVLLVAGRALVSKLGLGHWFKSWRPLYPPSAPPSPRSELPAHPE